jgi:hypothetical protein
MKSFKKHFRVINIWIFTAVIFGCGKEPDRTDYVAKVNNAYLTRDELNNMLDSSFRNDNFYRDELIRNWINRELLYQEAVKEGIPDEEEFKKVISDSHKELAASYLLNRYYEEENIAPEEEEISDYYKKFPDQFKILNTAYRINKAVFKTENKAVEFRYTVLETDWEMAAEKFLNDPDLISSESGKFVYQYDLYPLSLLKVASELYPDELSIILPYKEEKYFLIQMIEKYSEGTIPPLEVIKGQVINRLSYQKKEALIKDYIKELYSNNDIDVKKTGAK